MTPYHLFLCAPQRPVSDLGLVYNRNWFYKFLDRRMQDWTCPHCGAHSTLQKVNFQRGAEDVIIAKAANDEGIKISWEVVRCPSPVCNKFTVDIAAEFGDIVYANGYARNGIDVPADPAEHRAVGLGYMRFLPRVGKPLSNLVPKGVAEDYEEACTIKDLSPKAAATLCRRALQGMVRDFWAVSAKNLHQELQLIKDKCDEDLFHALLAIKSIGNIGAHPELDINVIVDVDEGEVDSLIEVLQILDKDWYVTKAEKARRLAAVQKLGSTKSALKSPSGGV